MQDPHPTASFRVVAAILLASVTAKGVAQTITVTTVADIRDAGYSATVATLPGPDGLVSFAEAMIAANNTPGRQTIGFAIPAGQLTAGRAVVQTGGGIRCQARNRKHPVGHRPAPTFSEPAAANCALEVASSLEVPSWRESHASTIQTPGTT